MNEDVLSDDQLRALGEANLEMAKRATVGATVAAKRLQRFAVTVTASAGALGALAHTVTDLGIDLDEADDIDGYGPA